MLQIRDIQKVYRTGPLVQQALDGVSLSLRDSEFVAILGQSGSGKTTLLNIIGGLDRYDEGDLIINGVSTKEYSDRDWDSYRNHTVGFVFQSYNLIPHQTILKNVELALTISGIPAGERTARATRALEQVGLSEHIHKKPSQLSGGQMQRVAIARALVNDPDILLADEPTGALDSETSLQVMDLLKEVARDRLVVMVTHNPELAERYATRVVTLRDGRITSDSDPYEPASAGGEHKNLGRASMSFLTALKLSFNNLWTKKTRTILVAFAGSIGIIGIALILSMSTGANEYIRSVEEESLQNYPLTITDTNISLASMFTEMADDESAEADKSTADEQNKKDVEEWRAVTGFFTGITSNDLKSLRAYFESDECDIYDYVQALEYNYNLTPQIYKETEDSYRQVNPDKTFAALGFSGESSDLSGLFTSLTSTDSFFPLPRDENLLHSAYELEAGSWPQGYDECVVILSPSGRVTDMTLYILGLKDPAELDKMASALAEGSAETDDTPVGSYSYDELMGGEFKVVPSSSYYVYDKDYKVWTERSSDKKYMKTLLKDADTIRVVGVVKPLQDTNATGMTVGFGYHAQLIDRIIDKAAESDIVKAQLKNPDTDVFTGEAFGESKDNSELNLNDLFSVDQKAIEKAFQINTDDFDIGSLSSLDLSAVNYSDIDFGSMLSESDLQNIIPSLSEKDIEELLSGVQINMTADDLEQLFGDVIKGYTAYAADDPRADVSALPSSFAQYLTTDEARELIFSQLRQMLTEKSGSFITEADLTAIIENILAGYPAYLSERGLSEEAAYLYLADYLATDDARSRAAVEVSALRERLSSLFTAQDAAALSQAIAAGYEQYAEKNNLPAASHLLSSFSAYMETDEAKKLITAAAANAVDVSGMEDVIAQYTGKVSVQMSAVIERILTALADKLSRTLQSGIAGMTDSLADSLLNVFSFDPAALSQMFKMNMSGSELKDLMVSLMTAQENSYQSNLKKLGYADEDNPSQITIYPRDFDSKKHIKDLISDYNRRMKEAGEDDKVIEYTDIVDALMGSVTIIIDVISYVLIAFVAISLVVSSIMIGVITYISVLERRKEIGILRAIGASKRNISQVFNAETFIIGSLAGVIGIGLSELIIIPMNLVIHSLSGVENINAVLPPVSAGILILLSIALTLIGGLIPSQKAAKSDPVTALRAE